MSFFSARPGLRWLVPAGAALAVIGGGAALRTVAAVADPTLPPRTAAQLLVDLQKANVDGLYGTVVQQADLGLPALPAGAGGHQGSADLASLLSNTPHTLRVWYSGPDNARLALLGTLGETDVIKTSRDVWIWNSQRNEATHYALPADADAAAKQVPQQSLPSTPQEAADLALRAVDPTTSVTTAGSARVAGRSAYELVLSPRDTASLIGQVRIAIDAKQHVPLRVQVYARRADSPSFQAAFTQVGFTRPDPAQFRFNPPAGAVVHEQQSDPSKVGQLATAQRPVVIGTGWTSVVVAAAPQSPTAKDPAAKPDNGGQAANPAADPAAAILERLPAVSGPWGSGRLLSGKLFSVLVTDDGRIVAGAVSSDRLIQALSDPAAAAVKGGR